MTRTIRRSEREDWIGPDIPSTTKKSYRSEEAGIAGGGVAASPRGTKSRRIFPSRKSRTVLVRSYPSSTFSLEEPTSRPLRRYKAISPISRINPAKGRNERDATRARARSIYYTSHWRGMFVPRSRCIIKCRTRDYIYSSANRYLATRSISRLNERIYPIIKMRIEGKKKN